MERSDQERALDVAYDHADRAYMALKPLNESGDSKLGVLVHKARELRDEIGASLPVTQNQSDPLK